MEKSDTIAELAGALLKVQAELKPMPKDKDNPFFHSKYIGLDTVMPSALALLNKHGLALVQTMGNGGYEGGSTLTTMLIHTSGEWLADTSPLLLAKSDPQGQGSAVTYARRYGLMAMLGIVAEEDDDGNRASPPHRSPAQEYAESGRPATAGKRSHPAPSEGGMRRMQSRYAGTCGSCGYEISKGEDILYDAMTKQAHHPFCIEGAPEGQEAPSGGAEPPQEG